MIAKIQNYKKLFCLLSQTNVCFTLAAFSVFSHLAVIWIYFSLQMQGMTGVVADQRAQNTLYPESRELVTKTKITFRGKYFPKCPAVK